MEMKSRILLALLLASCRTPASRYALDPVYDCTGLTTEQKVDMTALLDDCESWECDQRVMQLYCEEIPAREDAS